MTSASHRSTLFETLQVDFALGKGGGDCGFDFEVGRTYLVYAYGDAVLQTDICMPTKDTFDAESSELDLLRRSISKNEDD